VNLLFTVLRRLKSQGLGLVYISHKLSEIRQIADRITCLRDGENAGEAKPDNTSDSGLVRMMVGRDVDFKIQRQSAPGSRPVLEIRGLCGPPYLRDIHLKIFAGEIHGLAGLMGAGRSELTRLIMGATRPTSGQILLDGVPLQAGFPAQAVDAGLALLPEDRKIQGLVGQMNVRENSTLSAHRHISNRWGIIDAAGEKAVCAEYMASLRIKAQAEQNVFQLSGGNQQKVVLAKCLASRPKLLILDEPTRGIDVAAKAEIHRLIGRLADQGTAILMVSSELPEVLGISNRISVMREGRLVATFEAGQADEQALMHAALA
jgi:ABC-type sugar transport system ATPase subunit